MICWRAAVSSDGLKADTGAVSGLNMIEARFRPGAISESNSSHLPPSEGSKLAKPVTGRAVEPRDYAACDRIDDRDRPRLQLEGNGLDQAPGGLASCGNDYSPN